MSDYKYSIEAKNVNKTFIRKTQEVKALIDFSITIKKGTIHGLLGPNGAGKSTFINILGGLVKKNSGEVNICGINIDKNIKLSKFKIGIVPQELNIDPFFSPAELLELQAGLYGVPKKKRKTDEILENLKLTDQRNAYARTLSGGMRRRLLIGKALVHDPEIIILDEPTAGVDIDIRTSVWNYIKRISRQGKTVCLTTHYLEEAENLCDNITIINHGKKIIEGTKDNLLNIISTKSVTFVLNKNPDIPKDLKEFKPVINNGILKLSYDKNKTNIKKIIDILNKDKIDFKEINTFEGDLEDVFIKVVKKNDSEI
ncbi:ABC transporter ATP-binding protein [Pelagibacteraceae bacterium]|nr:ABC transporter ATP-binding protein [Pelagibacteraceae bacterium]